MLRRAALVLAVMVASWASAAQAHPHVWIDANVTFVFEQKMLTGVRLEWTFDEIFSTLVIREHDKNRNKAFEDTEIESVRKEAFVATKEFSYFTHVTVGRDKAQFGDVRDFKAEIVKGKLVYRFTLPLAQPVDPVTRPVAVRAFDETFYVDIGLTDGEPVKFSGMSPGLCTSDIAIAPTELGAFGLTDIKKIQLICPTK